MHGYQIWVALPKEKEEMQPQFFHAEASELPNWEEKGVSFTLVAGEAFGQVSPVPVHSELYMLELKSREATSLNLAGQLTGELGILVVDGKVTTGEEELEGGSILYSKVQDRCSLTLEKDSHILIFGGEPLPEHRHIAWNFVSSDPDRIDRSGLRCQPVMGPQPSSSPDPPVSRYLRPHP